MICTCRSILQKNLPAASSSVPLSTYTSNQITKKEFCPGVNQHITISYMYTMSVTWFGNSRLPAPEWQRCYYITSGEMIHVEHMSSLWWPSIYFISSQTSSSSSVYGTHYIIYTVTDGSGSPMTWEFITSFQQLASQLLPPHILCVCVCFGYIHECGGFWARGWSQPPVSSVSPQNFQAGGIHSWASHVQKRILVAKQAAILSTIRQA